MDMNLSQLQEIVKDRGAWRAAVHGVAKNRTRLGGWTTMTTFIWLWQVLVAACEIQFPNQNPTPGTLHWTTREVPWWSLNLPFVILDSLVCFILFFFLSSERDIKVTIWTLFWKHLYFIFWPCSAAWRILFLWPGVKLSPPALVVRSLNLWTAGELNCSQLLCLIFLIYKMDTAIIMVPTTQAITFTIVLSGVSA